MSDDVLFDYILEIGAVDVSYSDWLDTMLRKARFKFSDEEIKSAVENFVMSNDKKKKIRTTFFSEMKKYVQVAEKISEYGNDDVQFIIEELLYTIEFRIQTAVLSPPLQPCEAVKSRKYFWNPVPVNRCSDFNNVIPSFVLSPNGTVRLEANEQGKVMTLLIDLLRFDWLNLSDDAYKWVKVGGFINALSVCLSDFYFNMNNWTVKVSDVLTDPSMLNSLLIASKNSNAKFNRKSNELGVKFGEKVLT